MLKPDGTKISLLCPFKREQNHIFTDAKLFLSYSFHNNNIADPIPRESEIFLLVKVHEKLILAYFDTVQIFFFP
jgi:hypothetical protein